MSTWDAYYQAFDGKFDKNHYLRIALSDETESDTSPSIKWLEANGYTECGECDDIFNAGIGEFALSTEEVSGQDGDIEVDTVDIFHKPPIGWEKDDSWFEDPSQDYKRRTDFICQWFGIPSNLIIAIVIGECEGGEGIWKATNDLVR